MAEADAIDPATWDDLALRRALAARDIAAVFRALTATGVSQRRLAELTGMGASEVSEVLAGRRVMAYDVLVRVADGLGVPRGMMGLAYDAITASAYAGGVPIADPWEGVEEDMKRRHFLAAASAAVWGHPVLGKLLELPTPSDTPAPLPGRLAMSDVDAVRALTQQLQAVSRQYGGYAEGLSPVATRAEQLLAVPAAEPVKRALASAVAELHTVAAWAADDARLNDTARHHFTRAMDLAAGAGDHFAVSKAIYLSGVATAEQGHHDDGLKLLQLGQIRLGDATGHPRAPELQAWMSADAAVVLAQLGRPAQARSALDAARDTWRAPSTDDQADMDWVTALAEMRLGHLDIAEQLVSSSVRLWEGTADRRQATLGRITLAELHLRAGEPRGLPMAERVVRDVAELRSVRARDRLEPLERTLAARRDSAARDLARHAAAVRSTA